MDSPASHRPASRVVSRAVHRLNVSYLVVGLVFLGLAGTWALQTAGVVDTQQLGWLLPLMLVVAGALGLVAGGTRGRRRSVAGDDGSSPGPLEG